MIAVDTNILVYAHRADSEWHDRAAICLRELAEGRAPWAIPWPCIHECVGWGEERTPTFGGRGLRWGSFVTPTYGLVAEQDFTARTASTKLDFFYLAGDVAL